MREMDPYFLKTLYAEKNKDTGLKEIVGEKRLQELVGKWNVKLFGGPILGCVTDESTKIWVRTPGPASVQVMGEGFRSEVSLNLADQGIEWPHAKVCSEVFPRFPGVRIIDFRDYSGGVGFGVER